MNESGHQQTDAHRPERPPARHLLDLERGERRARLLVATIRSVTVAGALIVVFYLLPFDWSPTVQIAVGVSVGGLLIGGAGLWQLRAVANAEFPELRAIEAASFSASLLVVLFAGVYLSMSHGDVDAFSERLDHTGALYFTLTTLTTVGFGDIAARSNPARVAVMLQMVANFAVLGVVVKVIIGVARRRMTTTESRRTDAPTPS